MGYKYPIWRKARHNGLVVKFTGLQEGKVVDASSSSGYSVGDETNIWINHESEHWEDVTIEYENKLNFCTKHHTSYVTECHSCYREKTECIHGVPFDSECGECEELIKLYGMTSNSVEACHHGVPFKYHISCVKCYEEQKEIPFEPFTIEEVSCKEKIDSSLNNGGKTDEYEPSIPPISRYFADKDDYRHITDSPFAIDASKIVVKEGSTSHNNGGKTDYYQLYNAPFQIKDFDDFAELRNMNGNQFNMGKVMWTFNVGRHNGTDYERDLNKIIHYAQRELLRIKR